MTENNQKKLLDAIAMAHVGDSYFINKYGLNIKVQEVEEPSSEELEEMNETFKSQFVSQVTKKLEEDQDEEFFIDLLFSGASTIWNDGMRSGENEHKIAKMPGFIGYTKRNVFPIKRTPKWCPLNQ